jgi:hypothetical protein
VDREYVIKMWRWLLVSLLAPTLLPSQAVRASEQRSVDLKALSLAALADIRVTTSSKTPESE